MDALAGGSGRAPGARLPDAARQQIDGLVDALGERLGDALVGVYLHGSLAMGCFNPTRSDIDLLVVIGAAMALDDKRAIAALLLHRSTQPFPIEISFLRRSDLRLWRHPLPFDLHYSETWRRQVQEDLANGGWRRWIDRGRWDPDLAAHITVLRARGLRWYGPPIAAVFPAVAPADYLASIMDDFAEARDRVVEMPVYAALNACRVYRYLMEGAISSKEEAGAWALTALPVELRDVVALALGAYRGPNSPAFDPIALRRFASAIDARIQALAQPR